MSRNAAFLAGIICTQFLLFEHIRAQENQTPADAVTVELIEAGKGPLRELRFRPQKDSMQTSVMTMGLNQAMTIGGQKLPTQNIPATQITIETSVDKIAENGDVEFGYSYTKIDVVDDPANPSPLAAAMSNSMKSMVGTSGSAVINNRGFVQHSKINIPEGVPAQLKQSMEGMQNAMGQMSMPLPVEPVGVGGKWRVIQNVNANGLQIKQTSVLEITELNEDGFSMNVTVTQAAEPQEVKNSSLLPGTKINLKSLQSTGTGKSTLALSSIFPVRTAVTTNSQTAMSIEAAGQTQEISTDMKMELTLEPLP